MPTVCLISNMSRIEKCTWVIIIGNFTWISLITLGIKFDFRKLNIIWDCVCRSLEAKVYNKQKDIHLVLRVADCYNAKWSLENFGKLNSLTKYFPTFSMITLMGYHYIPNRRTQKASRHVHLTTAIFYFLELSISFYFIIELIQFELPTQTWQAKM